MPALCLASYGEEEASSVAVVLYCFIGFIYFLLTIVALVKIVKISNDVEDIKGRMSLEEDPYYYYLIDEKEKAKKAMIKNMVKDMEEKWQKAESLDMEKWKKKFERIGCEMPEKFKNIIVPGDYRDLFGRKQD